MQKRPPKFCGKIFASSDPSNSHTQFKKKSIELQGKCWTKLELETLTFSGCCVVYIKQERKQTK